MNVEKNLGIVTAYGSAIQGGYEGTLEEFYEMMGNLPQYASRAETAAGTADEDVQTVLDAKDAAETAAQNASDSASAATTAAENAADAQEAAEAAQQAAEDAAASITTDDTLSITGKAADAKKTGDEITELKNDLSKTAGLLGEDIEYTLDSTNGYIRYADGVPVNSANWKRTTYINIEGYDKLWFTRPTSTVDSSYQYAIVCGIAFFGSTTYTSYISGQLIKYDSTSNGYEGEYVETIPEGAKYARFTFHADETLGSFEAKGFHDYFQKIDDVAVSVGALSAALDDSVDSIEQINSSVADCKYELSTYKNDNGIVPLEWVQGGINTTSGIEHDSAIRIRTGYVETTSGQIYFIDNPAELHVLIYYYDSTYTFVSVYDGYINAENRLIIPENVSYFRVSVRYEESTDILPVAGRNVKITYSTPENNVCQYVKKPLAIGTANDFGSLIGNRSTLTSDENGTITATCNGGTGNVFGFFSILFTAENAKTNGHKWYVRLDGLDTSHVQNFLRAEIAVAKSGAAENARLVGTEGILTLSADCNLATIYFRTSETIIQGDYATVTGFQVVDLTEMFGEGNEPELETIQQIYGSQVYDRHIICNNTITDELKAIIVQTQAKVDGLSSADVAMGGILKSWAISSTLKATLYNNGTLWLSGEGTLPTYSYTNVPPWRTNEYMRCIKRIVIDETIIINYGLYACFTQYDTNNQALYQQNEYDGRIDYTTNIKCIYERDFGQFDYHHINLAKHKEPFDRVQGLPVPNAFKHALFSVPKEVANETFITNVKNMIVKANNTYNKHGVTLFITDSETLHQTVMLEVDRVYGSAYHNVASILVPDLAEDGFPSHWTEPMKRSLYEVIPYIGKQYMFYCDESDRDEAYPYRAKGLASMNTYAGYGWPDPFSLQAYAEVYYATPSDGEVLFNNFKAWSLSRYRGQPFSSSLEQITTGLSCSGFISWFYWRYFKENFSLGASRNYNTKLGPLDNPLPLKDISFDDLQPFDILSFAYDNNKDGVIDKNDNGGHVAIFLSKYTDKNGAERIIILNAGMGNGVTFGRWGFNDAWFEKEGQINTAKALRFDKESISINMISFYEKTADPDTDPDEGKTPDEGTDPDSGSEPEDDSTAQGN